MTARSFLRLGVVAAMVSGTLGLAIAPATAASITFCHVPPGNPGGANTITTGNVALANAHLQNHPLDHLGPCTGAEVAPAPGAIPATPLPAELFATNGFFGGLADASGGTGGDARGGDGGRGGSGTAPICNQSTNDEWWDQEPSVNCGAGGRGGDAGDGGESEGGDGGLAFAVDF